MISSDDMFLHPEDLLSTNDHVWHGTAIAWHKDLHSNITLIDPVSERFSGIRVKLGPRYFLAISLYLPTSGKDDSFLECLSSLLSFITENNIPGDSILIGADSNCSKRSTTRRIRALVDFCDSAELTRIGPSDPTFHHFNGTSATSIDCFFVSKDLVNVLTKVQVKCTLDEPLNLSAHDGLLTTIEVGVDDTEDSANYQYSDYKRARVLWNKDDLKITKNRRVNS